MPSESRIEARLWCLSNDNFEIGNLTTQQTEKLLTALYAAGAKNVYAIGVSEDCSLDRSGYSFTDTIHIETSMLNVAAVMSRLANFHPDETQLLPCGSGHHMIRAWWD